MSTKVLLAHGYKNVLLVLGVVGCLLTENRKFSE